MMNERQRLLIDDRKARVTVSLSLERRLSGHHLIKHYTQTKNIRALVDIFTQRLFGRHVTRSSHDGAGISNSDRNSDRFRIGAGALAIGQLCKSEVQHFHETIAHEFVLPQHNVFRFYVAVNNAFGVRRLECHCDLDTDAERLVQLQWTTPETVA